MKKLLVIGTALLAGALVADTVESSNTFGVLKVTPGTSATEVALCVPWVSAGTSGSGQSIKVKEVVKTSNLADGSVLLKYDGSKYIAWSLSSGTWGGVSTVTANGTTATEGGDDTLSRGDSLIIRPVWPENASDKNIYLYGQYQSVGVGEQTLPAGAWTLIAPPVPANSSVKLNDFTWSNVNAGDYIWVQNAKGYRLKALYGKSAAGKWAVYDAVNEKWDEDLAAIQPGMGGWYVNTGTSAATVTFEAAE